MRLLIVLLCLLAPSVLAGDIHASFLGSELSGGTLEETVWEISDAITDSSGNLIDISGENLIESSEDISTNWTTFNVSIVGTDTLHENTASAGHWIYHTNNIIAGGARYVFEFEAKAIGRNWAVASFSNPGTQQVYYDLLTGTVGTINGDVVDAGMRSLGGGWYKCIFIAYGINPCQPVIAIGESDDDSSYTGLDIDSIQVRRIRLYELDGYPSGKYHTTTGAAKPRFDMTPVNSPTIVTTSMQRSDGNLYHAVRGNGTNMRYDVAQNAYFDIFDSDHTLTVVYLNESIAPSGSDSIIGSVDGGGVDVFANNTGGRTQVRYYDGAWGFVELIGTHPYPAHDTYNVVHVTRSGNTAYLYINGDIEDTEDVTGYGADTNFPFSILGSPSTGNYLYGSIPYARLDAKHLTTNEIEVDYARIQSVLANTPRGPKNITFTRSTIGTIQSSTGKVTTHGISMPRVGGDDGGLLVESGTTQLHGLTKEFDSWVQDGTCIVTPNSAIAPDGTLTADLLDNTGGGNGDKRYLITANLGDVTGKPFTQSVWAKADTPHIITLRMYDGGASNTYAHFPITTQWKRLDMQKIMPGGATDAVWVFVYPGQNGVATGTAYFWRGNLTQTPFLVSGIANDGAATSQITSTIDNVYSEIADYTPESICSTCQASKIKISFDAKAHWSGSADLDVHRYFMSTSNSSLPNYIYIRSHHTTGLFHTSITDSSGVTHSIESGNDPVSYNEWNSYEVYFDLTDLSNSYQKINGVDTGAASVGMTGTATINFASTPRIRYGTNWSGSGDTQLMGRIKNPHIHWE